MSEFKLPDQLLYSKPTQTIDGNINWVSFTPVSGSTFTDGNSFKVRVSSTNEFLVVQRSYLKYTLKLTGVTQATTASVTTKLGGASALRRVVTNVGGVQVEDIDNYNTYVSTIYKRLPTSQQNFLKQVEGYQNQDICCSTATLASNGRTVCHALRTSIMECDQYLPLPFLQGGLEMEFTVETLNNIIATSASGATGVSVSNVEFVACMIKPSDGYLKQFQGTLASGKKGSITMVKTRNVRLNPSALTDQEQSLQIGFLRSLRSVLGITRKSTSWLSATTDSFELDTANLMSSYYFKVGSDRYPRNKVINTNNGTSGTVDAEPLMQSICALDNSYAHFNAVDVTANTANYIYFNWASSPAIGSGIPVEDGKIDFHHTYYAAPAATEYIDVFFFYDAILSFDASSISLNEKEF